MNDIQKAILKILDIQIEERFKLKHIKSKNPEEDEFYFDDMFRLIRVSIFRNAEKKIMCPSEEFVMIIQGDYEVIKL